MNEIKTPKKPLIYYYLVAMLVVLLFNFLAMPWLAEHQIKDVDYNTFVSMTEKKEIVKVVEGEVKETTEATEEEMTISAFDEVFDVDQVEKEAENLRKGRDYSRRGGTVRRRRSAEDEGLLCHAKRTDPHAASALGPLPVLLRQSGHQVVLLFSNCLFTLIVLMREQV